MANLPHWEWYKYMESDVDDNAQIEGHLFVSTHSAWVYPHSRVGIFRDKEQMLRLNDGCIILKTMGPLLVDQSAIYSCSWITQHSP